MQTTCNVNNWLQAEGVSRDKTVPFILDLNKLGNLPADDGISCQTIGRYSLLLSLLITTAFSLVSLLFSLLFYHDCCYYPLSYIVDVIVVIAVIIVIITIIVTLVIIHVAVVLLPPPPLPPSPQPPPHHLVPLSSLSLLFIVCITHWLVQYCHYLLSVL